MAIVVQNTTLRMTDLLMPTQYELHDLEATNVTFIGPAIIAIQGTLTLRGNNQFLNDLADIIWDIPDGRTTIVGAVGLHSPSFTDCRFQGIGIAGNHDNISQLMSRVEV